MAAINPATRASIEVVIRGYEMSSRGLVTPANFARYFEHARWMALSNPEFVASKHLMRGVVRAQRLALVEPATFGGRLAIETWVGRVGRSSLDLISRARATSDGREVGLASCTVVALGEDGKPSPLSPELEDCVVEDVEPAKHELPEAPTKDLFNREITVMPSDLDVFQHVNQARYIDFIEDLRTLACNAGNYQGDKELRRLSHLQIDYVREARMSQVLRAVTWAASPLVYGFLLTDTSGRVVTRARAAV